MPATNVQSQFSLLNAPAVFEFLYLSFMTLTPEQKEHAVELISMGDKLEAVRYFQLVLNIDAAQALTLAEKLQEEIEAEDDAALQDFEQQHTRLKTSGANVGRIVGALFMGIGMVMLAIVCYLIYSHQQFENRAKVVKATLTTYQSYNSRDNDGSSTTMYTPVFEYEFKGITHTHVSNTSSSSKDYEIGERVDMMVNPDAPQDVLIDSFMGKWFLPMLLGVMGAVFTGMGYLVYAVLGKQE